MYKIFIKPTSREILFKDSLKEGYLDIYSYDYHADEHKRKLGNLYIIGNVVQPKPTEAEGETQELASDATPDMAYMVNLVASLAKREYYSKPDLPPKDAFSATLKKINEVVDEFFKNKGAKINIGIFAVAEEDIHISKLGKFKIIMCRNNQTIDILNNITLFSKDHIEEKEFSNIISGKVHPGDKILAFYPSRFITSREKSIKDHFTSLNWTDFIEKINTIKGNKPDVACAALYIDINKIKESATMPRPQPEELKPKNMPVIAEEAQLVSFNENSRPSVSVEVSKPALPPSDVHEPKPNIKVYQPKQVAEQEVPKIIPSEFSSATKENIFHKLSSKLRSFRRDTPYGRIGKHPSFAFKKQISIAVPAILIVAASAWLAKTYVFISPQVREQRKLTKSIEDNIKLAQEKVNGHDSVGARGLLFGSLAKSVSSDKDKELMSLLDKADGAVQGNPVLVDKLPDEVSKKADELDVQETKTKSGKYNISSPAISMDLYQNNLYILTKDKIYKIVDAQKNTAVAVSWLKDGTSLPDDASLTTVDGNVYVVGKSGIITKYYKGGKAKEYNTAVVAEDSIIMTANDIPGLYIINKKLGRIYVIDKESGTITKVTKIGNSESLAAVYLDSKGVVYLETQDNKVWKIE